MDDLPDFIYYFIIALGIILVLAAAVSCAILGAVALQDGNYGLGAAGLTGAVIFMAMLGAAMLS